MFTITLNFISYLLIRSIMLPVVWMPYKMVHTLGKKLGTLLFHLIPKLRKRALSNLALAKELNLSTEEIEILAIESVQNLVITCLEYPKLSHEKDITNIANCQNPEVPQSVLDKGQGVIYFCGHQANWEILFLDGSSRHAGTAIGRPIKNRFLYKWILSIREKCGGTMISPKNALKESLRTLKRGQFVGIVGDQGMPDSGFSSPFLGRQAWTSPLPALLSYRTGCPIIVATTTRVGGKYLVHYADPIWPNREAPSEKEVPRLMLDTLSILQESIKENIGQWLWTHNRWKQQLPGILKRRFRHDTIGVILPDDPKELSEIIPHLPLFRKWYPQEILTLFAPTSCQEKIPPLENVEIKTYTSLSDLFKKDYLHKLIFNFSKEKKLKAHYLALSAFGVYSLSDLKTISGSNGDDNLSTIIETALSNHAL